LLGGRAVLHRRGVTRQANLDAKPSHLRKVGDTNRALLVSNGSPGQGFASRRWWV
jgi:hypothetical protein